MAPPPPLTLRVVATIFLLGLAGAAALKTPIGKAPPAPIQPLNTNQPMPNLADLVHKSNELLRDDFSNELLRDDFSKLRRRSSQQRTSTPPVRKSIPNAGAPVPPPATSTLIAWLLLAKPAIRDQITRTMLKPMTCLWLTS